MSDEWIKTNYHTSSRNNSHVVIEANDDPSNDLRLLMGPEQVARPKTLQAV
jgi:hypothetical protein